MKAPEYERMELLRVAIERATQTLGAPIDRVEVTAAQVICWAGAQKVALAYSYVEAASGDSSTGQLIPGSESGGWQVTVIDGPPVSQPEIVGRTLAKFLKSRGW